MAIGQTQHTATHRSAGPHNCHHLIHLCHLPHNNQINYNFPLKERDRILMNREAHLPPLLLTKSLSKHTFILVKTFKLPRSPRQNIFHIENDQNSNLPCLNLWPQQFSVFQQMYVSSRLKHLHQRWKRTKIAKTLSWFYHIEQPIIAHIIEHLIISW
jgi:hypothetical protein